MQFLSPTGGGSRSCLGAGIISLASGLHGSQPSCFRDFGLKSPYSRVLEPYRPNFGRTVDVEGKGVPQQR